MKENRARSGIYISAAGIFCNLALAAAKIAVGAIFGLISVISDGVNNLTDCGSGAVSLTSFAISSKPADKEHPYGHRRAEYIASFIIGFLVLIAAAELAREGVLRIVRGGYPEINYIVFTVLACSVAVKGGMAVFYGVYASRLKAEALKASCADSLSDCAATAAVIIGALITKYAGVNADGFVSVLVSLFILWQGISVIKSACSELLGQAPDPAVAKSLAQYISSGENVIGIHDLHIFAYGADVYYATVHVEMDCRLPAMQAHAVLDGLERKVREELNVDLTCHLDPVDLNDGLAAELKTRLTVAAKRIDPALELHDFRLVRGAKDKLVFDAGAPYSLRLSDGEIKSLLKEQVKKCGDYDCVINVDRE